MEHDVQLASGVKVRAIASCAVWRYVNSIGGSGVSQKVYYATRVIETVDDIG